MNRPISEPLVHGRRRAALGPAAAVAVVATALAVVAGVGAGKFGWPLLLGVVGIFAAAGVLYRPFFGVLLLAATIPMEAILTVEGLGLGRVIGMAVFAAWLVQKIVLRQSWRRVVSNGFFVAALLFLALVIVSLLWAEHPAPVRSGFIRLAQMVVLAFIIIDLADSRRRLDRIAQTLVLTAMVAAGITLYQAEILEVRRAGGDVAGDINDTAMVLVTLLPLGFFLLRTSSSFIWKLLATLFIGISAVSIVTTYSRMSLLLLPPLMVLLFVLAVRDRQARGWLLAVGVATAVGGTLFVPWDKLGERTKTIGTYVDQTAQFGQQAAATSPRGYHLRIGLAIAREHPVLGAGYGNYGYLFRDQYQYQVAGRDVLYTSVRSAHSAYLGIAADLGIVGLACWLLVLLSCAVRSVRAWRRVRSSGSTVLTALNESLLVMVGLHNFAYGFYAPIQIDKLLWVVMAMCVAAGYISTTNSTLGTARRDAQLQARDDRLLDSPRE